MRILVVEDDPDHRWFIERALRKRGHEEIFMTTEISEALEVVREHPCDVAILDSGAVAPDQPYALAALRASCIKGAYVIGFSASHPRTHWADFHLLKSGPEAFEELAEHIERQAR